MTYQFTDKVAIITGASSGIGRAYARQLSAAGAKVVLVGRDATRLAEAQAELSAESTIINADVSQAGAADLIVAHALETFGTIDIVLSNAGIYFGGEFAESDPVAMEKLFSINVFGALAIVRAALPHLLEKGEGDVIMTSSVSGHQPIYWEPIYTASKHAVQAFVHAVRRQLVGTGVRLGEIAPGVVLNPIWGFAEDSDEAKAELAKGVGIRSDDVADAVLYMLSRPRHVNIRDLVILPASQEI